MTVSRREAPDARRLGAHHQVIAAGLARIGGSPLWAHLRLLEPAVGQLALGGVLTGVRPPTRVLL